MPQRAVPNTPGSSPGASRGDGAPGPGVPDRGGPDPGGPDPGGPDPGGADEAWAPRGEASTAAPIVLPGYQDFVLVGSGGDSIVYRARQEGLDRPVAVKVLSADPDVGDAAQTRFQRELEITVRLGRAHPHIVTVLDTRVTNDGRPCIVMDYYDLGSLHDQLRTHGPLPASAVVAAGTVVADALHYAHRQGVVHRDVKPQNILVLPTSYVLADFGLARRLDAGHSASLERFSYRHAAPQVLDGELPTVADDIYSLGSTLFTLLDGRPPFATDDPDDTALAYLRRVRTERPRPIRSSDATPELLAIIERCLAKRREDRFADAAILRDALGGVVTEARVWSRSWRPGAIPGLAETAREATSPRAAAALPASGARPDRPPRPSPQPPPSHGPVRHWMAPAAIPEQPPAPPRQRKPDPPPPPRPVDEVTPEPATSEIGGGSLPDEADDTTGERRPNWSRIVLLAAVALVVGIGVGMGAPWLAARTGSSGTPTGQVREIPTFTGSLPPTFVTRPVDPALAPEISALDDRGASIELEWTDPSQGAARFVVVQVDGDDADGVLNVDPGVTAAVVHGLDPGADRYCFHIIAVTADGQAISPLRCTEERAPRSP